MAGKPVKVRMLDPGLGQEDDGAAHQRIVAAARVRQRLDRLDVEALQHGGTGCSAGDLYQAYAGFPKSVLAVFGENPAKSEDTKRAFVGEAKNVCLVPPPVADDPFRDRERAYVAAGSASSNGQSASSGHVTASKGGSAMSSLSFLTSSNSHLPSRSS